MRLKLLISLCTAFVFSACGGSSSAQSNLKDIPEICRGYDFQSDPSMADICGLRKSRYNSYKNFPTQRYMIAPKGTAVVLLNEAEVEMRLPNTQPILLPEDAASQIDFSKGAQRKKLPNQYIYEEFYPENSERIRIFKMIIPTISNSELEACFKIPEKKTLKRRKSVLGRSLERIQCQEFDSLVNKYKS